MIRIWQSPMMDIPPVNPPAITPAQLNALREGVLLLKGLMNNSVSLSPGKSLLVELLTHLPLPVAAQNNLPQLAKINPPPLPSWQPLLGDAPLELVELKLPSGQKIWATTLRSSFETVLNQLPPKALLEVRTSKDGQLVLQPPSRPESVPAPLVELWRKSLPIAQSPKSLMQLMTPLVKPLANLTPTTSHPLQPIQQFMQRQTHQLNSLLSLVPPPITETKKQQISQVMENLISNSGVKLEAKLRSLIGIPEGKQASQLDEITTQDFKAQILKSVVAINHLTPQAMATDDELPEHLWRLFTGSKETENTPATKNGGWLLLETLLPSLQKTLAGIQLQQAHSLAEQAKAPGAVQFEIPIPSPDGWINLSAQLTPMLHNSIEDAESQAQKARGNANSWRLLLEFMLPQNGLLAVQFIWQPGHLRGQVWANQPRLKEQLKEQLRSLKKSLLEGGINAEQLHITDDPISKPPLPINQPLVDIQT